MSNGYKATLSGEQKIYIADWTPSVAIQNLTQAGKYIGIDNLLAISKLGEYSTHTVILAITESNDAETTMALIRNFVCSAAMEGERITEANFDKTFGENLYLVVEVFAHVVHAQYANFFELGLVEA